MNARRAHADKRAVLETPGDWRRKVGLEARVPGSGPRMVDGAGTNAPAQRRAAALLAQPPAESENRMSEDAPAPAFDWITERAERMTVTPALARLWLREH